MATKKKFLIVEAGLQRADASMARWSRPEDTQRSLVVEG